jgi:hypothetical protein
VRAGQSAEAESLVVSLRRVVIEPGVAASCDQELNWIHARRAAPPAAKPAAGAPPKR